MSFKKDIILEIEILKNNTEQNREIKIYFTKKSIFKILQKKHEEMYCRESDGYF